MATILEKMGYNPASSRRARCAITDGVELPMLQSEGAMDTSSLSGGLELRAL
jgi:hypothetical protein